MSDCLLVRFAKFYAATKHAGQQYSGGLPYTHHLAAVENVLRRFSEIHNATLDGYPEYNEVLAAAWLHDVVEDTPTKIKEIIELFGAEVANLVFAVTNEPGPNRKMRAAITYPKIRRVRLAVHLKLADRIANVETGGNLVQMYKDEYEDFRRALRTPGVADAMWAHLDGLMEYKP